jgi:hypothetical protein
MENHRVDDKETQLNIDDADRSTNVQGVASTTTNISSDDKQVNIESNSIEKMFQLLLVQQQIFIRIRTRIH